MLFTGIVIIPLLCLFEFLHLLVCVLNLRHLSPLNEWNLDTTCNIRSFEIMPLYIIRCLSTQMKNPLDCIWKFWNYPFQGKFFEGNLDNTCNARLCEIMPLYVFWWYDWFHREPLTPRSGWEHKSRSSLSSHAQNNTRTWKVLTLSLGDDISVSYIYIPSMHHFLLSDFWTREAKTTQCGSNHCLQVIQLSN